MSDLTTPTEALTKAPTKRRQARAKGAPAPASAQPAQVTIATPNKLDRLGALLQSEAGATITTMMAATGWQAHSVRGALAGALKKRGLAITSDKFDGVRIYRASVA
jgi:hypothetical protein